MNLIYSINFILRKYVCLRTKKSLCTSLNIEAVQIEIRTYESRASYFINVYAGKYAKHTHAGFVLMDVFKMMWHKSQ